MNIVIAFLLAGNFLILDVLIHQALKLKLYYAGTPLILLALGNISAALYLIAYA
jgi:hypothetical protein